METIRKLEEVLMESMKLCQERTVKSFGRAEALEEKSYDPLGMVAMTIAGQALTVVDLENQETILQHLYPHFPEIELSTEEGTDHPTEVQAAFYRNDGKSNLLVQLDPIDGTYCYKEGIRPDYGIIASILERTSPQEGRFISAVIYYPSLDTFLLANETSVTKINGKERQKLQKETSHLKIEYSTGFVADKDRLGFAEELPYLKNLYSTTQAALQMCLGEIPGFIMAKGKLNDWSVAAWISQRYGADVEYASGKTFGAITFGDILNPDGKRIPRRDTNGLIIVGDKEDECFQRYKQAYHRRG